MNSRKFVGFGFGPIQSGLFVYEAWRSGRFTSFIVAEIDDRMVSAVNGNGGRYTLNIAHPDSIERCEVSGVRMLNPRVPADRAALIQAVREADELATALPRVECYEGDDTSVVSILSEALALGTDKCQVLYTAENHNHAAEILDAALRRRLPSAAMERFQPVNTVIGKMSGLFSDPTEILQLGLAPMAPGIDKAVLVEVFNRILISRISMPGGICSFNAFAEKPDLLPFEEAKLYGHNAIHALMGYLAHDRGCRSMAQVADHTDLLKIAREAFIGESGRALCRKYGHIDPLFTPDGFTEYADDLLRRMVNPNLNDLVERVIRDPQRKLGWSDRLFGTMRLALEQQVMPTLLAQGAASATRYLMGRNPSDEAEPREVLMKLWGNPADEIADQLIRMTWNAMKGRV